MEKIAEKAISSDYHLFPGKKERFLVLHPGHLMVRTGAVGQRMQLMGITWGMGLWSAKGSSVALGELIK